MSEDRADAAEADEDGGRGIKGYGLEVIGYRVWRIESFRLKD